MAEDDIDISNHRSNHIDEYRHIDFDYVITVCDNAKERCPYFPTHAKKLHHDFPDPAKATGTDEAVMAQFRTVRNMSKTWCINFTEWRLR